MLSCGNSPGGDRLHRSILDSRLPLMYRRIRAGPSIHHLARLRRQRRFRAILRARADQSLERRASSKSPGPTRPATAGSTSSIRSWSMSVMYVLGKNNSIVALDAATGKEIWTYAPGAGHQRSSPIAASTIGRARTAPTAACCSASNHFLRAIDARTGKADPVVRRWRQRRSESRDWAAIPRRFRWCSPPRRAACSKTC